MCSSLSRDYVGHTPGVPIDLAVVQACVL